MDLELLFHESYEGKISRLIGIELHYFTSTEHHNISINNISKFTSKTS